ncbi:hypothetical protein [Streptomyces sp. NPDC051014]|uniref:hypothetical protein n=1 Tax=Streptomyces sp. NPDC051014 TaxID=3155751 RepID=UPI0033F534C2
MPRRLPPPLWADLFLGGQWSSITGDVALDSAVTVKRGRTGERDSAGPAQGALPLINRGAKYSRRNPNSPLFGAVGLNSPVRYGVQDGSPWVLCEGTGNTGSYLSTPSSTGLNISGDLEVRFELSLDNPDTTQDLAARWGAAGSDSWLVGLGSNSGRLGVPFIAWSTDGTAAAASFATASIPAMPGQRLALRIVLDVNNGNSGKTVTFYTAKRIDAEDAYWQMLGTPVVTAGTISIFNPTSQALWLGRGNTGGFDCLSGRLFRFQLYSGGSRIVDLNAATAATGAASLADAQGRTWTLQGACSVTNKQRLFQGEISAWNPSRDKSGNDRRVQTAPAGIMQRLGSGNKQLRSPLFREMTNPGRSGIVAYWPCEEVSGSTVVSSGLGQSPMRVTGTPNWGSYSKLLGSDALPDLSTSTLTAAVRSYTVTGETSMRSWVAVPSGGVGAQASLYQLTTTGSAATWEMFLETDGDITLRVTADDGTSLLGTRIDFNENGRLISVVLEATQDGADIDWALKVENYTGATSINDSVSVTSATGTFTSQTFGRITGLTVGRTAGLSGVSVGHITIANSLAAYSKALNAAVGWRGEGARARFNRLCQEQNVPGAAGIDTTYQAYMGAQKSGKFLDLLREVETVDGGILTERPDGLGLALRGASTMWGQQPVLVLDWTAGLINDVTPKDDDKAAFNEVTAKRVDGAEYTYTLDTGVNSVEDIGLYDTAVELSLDSDDALPSQAFRRVQLATVDELRWPQITLSLANERVYAMLDTLYSVDIGDLIRLDHIPADYGAGYVDLIVVGILDAEGPKDWSRSFVCVPGEPWNARNASGTGAAAPVVYEDFEDTTYAVTITNGGTLPWTRTNTRSNTGSWSLRSGAISNNQTSVATVAVPAGAASLVFWYRTSSEAAGPGFLGDRLTATVDGTQVLLAQGETVWTPLILDVAGKSAVAFTYTKDNSASSGEDAAYIDDLTFVLTAHPESIARADTSGCLLAEDLDATETAVDVLTGIDLARWVDFNTYPTDFPFDVDTGGETMRVIACDSAVRDTFTRTVASGWGTASVGGSWSTAGGSSSEYAVNGSVGTHSQTSVNVSRYSLLPSPSADVDLVGDFASSALAVGGPEYMGLVARYLDGNNLYYARCGFATNQTITLVLQKRVAGVQTDLTTVTVPYTHVVGAFERIRFQVVGSVLRAKLWDVGTPEPVTWQATAMDTALTAAGSIGVRTVLSSLNTNTLPVTTSVDNFTLLNPQTFTVARSINGVIKAHAAGQPISLAHPTYAA